MDKVAHREKKVMLREIALLRPMAILLIIVYHSFVCYTGAWTPFDGYVDCRLYFWFAKALEFLPALFMLVSGYVFSFQINDLKREYTLSDIMKRKANRLLVPSILLSVLYIALFFRESDNTIIGSLLKILEGAGHLWFLPTLFWCFIVGTILTIWKLDENTKIKVLFAISIFGWLGMALHLPFGLNRMPFYLFFFYLGYILFFYRDGLQKFVKNKKFTVFTVLLVFFIAVLLSIKVLFIDVIPNTELKVVSKGMILSLKYVVRGMLYTEQVIFVFLIIFKWIGNHSEWVPSKGLLTINMLCFGVYLYHQFIIKSLYYYTSLPTILGPYSLPVVGMLITIVVSFVLSYLTHLIKMGRAYFG